MTIAIRTERRFGVTARLEPTQLRNLFALLHSETWPDLLDVMEQCCIEVETVLINTPVENKTAVLENHKLSKAAWMIFEHLQNKMNAVENSYMASVDKPVYVPQPTREEMERENLLNPTLYATAADDTYGI
jgi:L-rhamnose mutarotase